MDVPSRFDLRVLVALEALPEATVTELVRALALPDCLSSKTTVGKTLRRLEGRHLVTRRGVDTAIASAHGCHQARVWHWRKRGAG